jgi:hypothetical protein
MDSAVVRCEDTSPSDESGGMDAVASGWRNHPSAATRADQLEFQRRCLGWLSGGLPDDAVVTQALEACVEKVTSSGQALLPICS